MESMRGFVEDTTQARVKDKRSVVRRGGTSVIDRAANWVHAKPMRKRRIPPQGIPQLSVEKILSVPPDILDDNIFNTEIGDEILPKGSFLEVRRSVHVKSLLFSSVHESECVGTIQWFMALLWVHTTPVVLDKSTPSRPQAKL